MTTFGTPFEGIERVHYEDCVRSIPAILLARLGDRPHEAHVLYVGLERGLDAGVCWGIFSAAAMAWLQQTWVALADAAAEPVSDLLYKAIAASADWANT